jgi:hypothetical protein
MTGLVRRAGRSFRLVRTSIEITVLAVGWLMGGVVGLGTVLYAVLIGPVVQVFLPVFTVPLDLPRDAGSAASGVDRQHEGQDARGAGLAQGSSGDGEGPARAGDVVDEQDGAVQPA